MSKVRLGIIGYGNIGSQHGRAIRDGKTPQVDLTAVADIDEKRLELAKSTHRKRRKRNSAGYRKKRKSKNG